MNSPIKDIDTYISLQPETIRHRLEKIREAIKSAAPDAEEVISYQMPAFKYHGVLVYFAAWKHHIGLYPTSSGIAAFKNALSKYEGAKGSVQFPNDKPLPLNLISRIVKFKVKENLAKVKSKKNGRK